MYFLNKKKKRYNVGLQVVAAGSQPVKLFPSVSSFYPELLAQPSRQNKMLAFSMSETTDTYNLNTFEQKICFICNFF